MRKALLFIMLATPGSVMSQSFEPSVELGLGVTASRQRSGEAISGQAGATILRIADIPLRAELFYQEGSIGGARKCERLSERYCIGTTDRNRIGALVAALHMPLGTRAGYTAYVPLGAGLYNRRTRTTESEGPIEICTVNGELVPCAGNPPLSSITYDTDATVPGYTVGVGVIRAVSRVKLYLELRAHDMLETNSQAGAVTTSFGVRF